MRTPIDAGMVGWIRPRSSVLVGIGGAVPPSWRPLLCHKVIGRGRSRPLVHPYCERRCMPAGIVLSTLRRTNARCRCSFCGSVRGLVSPSSRDPQPRPRCRTASNSSTAAAAETFSESTLPRDRDRDQRVAALGDHAAAGPLPSLPITSTTLPVRSTLGVRLVGARVGAVDPGARRPSPRPASRRGSRTRAIGRCSTAPAEALQAAAVTEAARRSGITSPVAPAASAERATAPRLCGSWTWSSATIRRVGLAQQRRRVGVRVGIDLGDDALMVGRAGEPGQLGRVESPALARRGAPCAARARPRPPARRP